MLHREDGPAMKNSDGGTRWMRNGKEHREGAPAVEDRDGYKEWWVDGQRHREDGPAVEDPRLGNEWWVEGKEVTEEEVEKIQNLKRLSGIKLGAPDKVVF
jgi:hypothetical protein